MKTTESFALQTIVHRGGNALIFTRRLNQTAGIGKRTSPRLEHFKRTVLLILLVAGCTLPVLASDPIGIYASIDKVIIEPGPESPERIQIWGAFALAKGAGITYAPAQRGYLYYTVNPEKPEVCRKEWADLKSVASSSHVVGFGARYGSKGRVRSEDEPAKDPDVYPLGWGVSKARNTDYSPVRDLLALRKESPAKTGDSSKKSSRPSGSASPGLYIHADAGSDPTNAKTVDHKMPFKLRPGQYILSGGPDPSDSILVDDDLILEIGDRVIFKDNDGCRSDETRSIFNRKYQGAPVIFSAKAEDTLRIQAIDVHGSDAVLGPLYLHRYDGGARKLVEEIHQSSQDTLPYTFYDRKFELNQLFEKTRGAVEKTGAR